MVKAPISPPYIPGISSGSGGIANDIGESVSLQAEGKIIVAGTSTTDGLNSYISLVRYNTDGSLDTSFGGDGKVTTDIPDSDYGAAASSVIIQTDGKF